ncbi:hypothetical protein MPER_00998, partial [Moniliophthora perniciosa FA553]
RAITTLISLTLPHKKSSVRFLGGIVWRTMTWAYFQPPLPADPDGESEVDDEETPSSPSKTSVHTRDQYWKILGAVMTMGIGVSTVAALVGGETGEEETRRLFHVLELMMRKNIDSFKDAMQVITQLLSLSSVNPVF